MKYDMQLQDSTPSAGGMRSAADEPSDDAVPPTAGSVRIAQRLWAPVAKLSLFQQFLFLSLAILVIGAYIIGSYVSGEIKERVMQRTSAITALYVDSFISPHLQELSANHDISPAHLRHLDELIGNTSLGQEIVAFKVWHVDGEVVYASERSLIGQAFPIGGGLETALGGGIQTHVSSLADEENQYERSRWSRLLETYAPVRAYETGQVIGASEFYQDPSALESEIASSQRKGWLIVGGATATMYLLLLGMVKGASSTISRQHGRLKELVHQNADLAQRVRRAAAQKSETDEHILKRVAHDLHDGPAQDISLALLRLDSVLSPGTASSVREHEVKLMRSALSGALREIRQIGAGLRLPELEGLGIDDVVKRAAEEHRAKTGSAVMVEQRGTIASAGLPTKIALYRVTQEALNNAHAHGEADQVEITLDMTLGLLDLTIADNGKGLPGASPPPTFGRTHLGIRGMKERVEMLGGSLEVSDRPAGGTVVRARLPIGGSAGDD